MYGCVCSDKPKSWPSLNPVEPEAASHKPDSKCKETGLDYALLACTQDNILTSGSTFTLNILLKRAYKYSKQIIIALANMSWDTVT